jgi:hypothetical protein
MAEKQPKKKSQLSLDEYNKIKEKRAQSKLKLHFPWPVKLFILLPVGYIAFLIVYYLLHLRFATEH